ncbi:MAG: D-amino acid aminotransferase [Pseudomonadota bacterium]
MSLVFLNGQWCPIENAKVSVLDRGFMFGDGVYEVVPVYERKPYRLQQHLNRLQYCLDGLSIPNPYTNDEWVDHIHEGITQHHLDNQSVYIQVTRGVAPRGAGFPEKVTPTVVMMGNPLRRPSPEQVAYGVKAITMEDQRWLHCNYKTTSLLGNILAFQNALAHEAVEAILFRNGFLTEGALTNVIVVREGSIIVPPKSNLVLYGITMDAIIELAPSIDIPIRYEALSENDVRTADEIWISSSTAREIVAVTTLDEAPVGNGRPGEIYKRMYNAYQNDIQEQCFSIPLHHIKLEAPYMIYS